MNGPQMDICRVRSRAEESHLCGGRNRFISPKRRWKTVALLFASVGAVSIQNICAIFVSHLCR